MAFERAQGGGGEALGDQQSERAVSRVVHQDEVGHLVGIPAPGLDADALRQGLTLVVLDRL
ncbi:MAG: hypothetical protein KC619_16975, partial [Myxococcales bacterium]|nr:hypothetical protein [Myxococcales bacterium]